MMTLPLPPSTNNLFANGKHGGRFKTDAYKQWLNDAGWELKTQRPQRVAGWVDITILLPEAMRGDADNRIKPVLDLLVKQDLIDDDCKVYDLRVTRDPRCVTTCMVEVRASVRRAA
jgi:Holliday junction resolvase RusA-like endonuclease